MSTAPTWTRCCASRDRSRPRPVWSRLDRHREAGGRPGAVTAQQVRTSAKPAWRSTLAAYFFQGDQVNLRDVVARVLPAWPRGVPGASFVEAMYAFGLEECGDYGAAERHGRAALDVQRRDVWAAHAVIHVLEMEGRQPEGLAFVAASAPDWSHSYFAVHNWWHSALYRLELGQETEAISVYDRGQPEQ